MSSPKNIDTRGARTESTPSVSYARRSTQAGAEASSCSDRHARLVAAGRQRQYAPPRSEHCHQEMRQQSRRARRRHASCARLVPAPLTKRHAQQSVVRQRHAMEGRYETGMFRYARSSGKLFIFIRAAPTAGQHALKVTARSHAARKHRHT